jgi:hypothetical protein
VPRQDGVDGLTKHGERRLEGQRVPQEGPEQIVAHGEELWQHALPHRPGEDRPGGTEWRRGAGAGPRDLRRTRTVAAVSGRAPLRSDTGRGDQPAG